jgi:hypothetical protein
MKYGNLWDIWKLVIIEDSEYWMKEKFKLSNLVNSYTLIFKLSFANNIELYLGSLRIFTWKVRWMKFKDQC